MNIHDILELNHNWFDSFFVLWGLYITLSVGILGYVGMATDSTTSSIVRVILILSFAMFAFVNWSAIDDVRQQREDIYLLGMDYLNLQNTRDLIPQQKSQIEKILQNSQPFGKYHVSYFHWFIDFLIILTIWFLPSQVAKNRRINALKNALIKSKGKELPTVLISRHAIENEWILGQDCTFSIGQEKFKIEKDFSFDLASVPRALWWLIAPFELSLIAPLVHDYIYRNGVLKYETPQNNLSEKIFFKEEADEIFLNLMEEEGVKRFRRKLAYYGVKWLGHSSWKGKQEPPMGQTAPTSI